MNGFWEQKLRDRKASCLTGQKMKSLIGNRRIDWWPVLHFLPIRE